MARLLSYKDRLTRTGGPEVETALTAIAYTLCILEEAKTWDVDMLFYMDPEGGVYYEIVPRENLGFPGVPKV